MHVPARISFAAQEQVQKSKKSLHDLYDLFEKQVQDSRWCSTKELLRAFTGLVKDWAPVSFRIIHTQPCLSCSQYFLFFLRLLLQTGFALCGMVWCDIVAVTVVWTN
jgi:hypothetical protein